MSRNTSTSRRRASSLARLLLPLPGMLLATGCTKDPAEPRGSAGDAGAVEMLPDLHPLATPPGGLAFYSPIFRGIQPGEDVTYCTATDHVTEEELFINTTNGVESSMGHHVILLYTTTPMEPGTKSCTGQGMETLTQLIGGSGGEGTAVYQPPPNVGMLVPKGSQFIVQTHWINTGDEPVDVQAMAVTVPGTDGPDRIVAGTMSVVNIGFSVPPMEKEKSSVECVFDGEHQMMTTLGHEHEWGEHVRATLTRKDGAVTTLFDRNFSPNDVFDPPVDVYPIDAPLTFHAGDKLTMECDWNNTTSEALSFPREMCVFFGYTLAPGDVRCINGNWLGGAPAGDGGLAPDGPPCAADGDPGNDKGVGRFCSKDGKQCNGSAAGICIADYSTTTFGNFCTTLCSNDADCGAGATCLSTGQANVCMPTHCLGPADAGTAAP